MLQTPLCYKPLLLTTIYLLFGLGWRRIWFPITTNKWNCPINTFSAHQDTIYSFQSFKASSKFQFFSQSIRRNLRYLVLHWLQNIASRFCKCNLNDLHRSFQVSNYFEKRNKFILTSLLLDPRKRWPWRTRWERRSEGAFSFKFNVGTQLWKKMKENLIYRSRTIPQG